MHLGGGNVNILDISLSHYLAIAILSNETNFRDMLIQLYVFD